MNAINPENLEMDKAIRNANGNAQTLNNPIKLTTNEIKKGNNPPYNIFSSKDQKPIGNSKRGLFTIEATIEGNL